MARALLGLMARGRGDGEHHRERHHARDRKRRKTSSMALSGGDSDDNELQYSSQQAAPDWSAHRSHDWHASAEGGGSYSRGSRHG